MSEWAPLIVPIIMALFGGGGVALLLRVRPEAGSISVKAAGDAVILQDSVLDNLKEELDRQSGRISELEQEARQVPLLRKRIEQLEQDLELTERRLENTEAELIKATNNLKAVTRERDSLRSRVTELEREMAIFKNGKSDGG